MHGGQQPADLACIPDCMHGGRSSRQRNPAGTATRGGLLCSAAEAS